MRESPSFGSATLRWFRANYKAPSPVQEKGWPYLLSGNHSLLLAPTGNGKTLAAFLAGLDRLLHRTAETSGTQLLYVSPIKSLAYDIEKNLNEPLEGIRQYSDENLAPVSVAVRTGDTSPSERRRQLRSPSDILITTPESLYLLLGSNARVGLQGVQTVIIDEIHALASNKRGVHLMLCLERLDRLCERDVQRIGLSATQRPLRRVAAFLGGDRDVKIVDCSAKPKLSLEIQMPVAVPADNKEPSAKALPLEAKVSKGGMWDLLFPKLLQMVLAHRTTLIFCNSRRLAERMAQNLNELAGTQVTRAHHGSVARHQRQSIEAQLKRGELRALVATSSLELGIDMSSIDLVIQVESPGSVARGLQRVGRAGHSLGTRSHGIIIAKFKGDLLESTVVGKQMMDGHVEQSQPPKLCLDILAQQIVAMCSVEALHKDVLFKLLQRSYSYQELSLPLLDSVLGMLSGNYPSDELQDLKARITWNRQDDMLQARRGAKMMSLINGGTIPDRGLFAVHLGKGGPRIGELDEEMVYEARIGETFYLGASTWRIQEVTRDQVIVAPAPGQSGKMPFWRGSGPGRPMDLGRALGAFCRTFALDSERQAQQTLTEQYKLDPEASRALLTYLNEQREATGVVPSDRAIVLERFCDEVGDWRLCILSPFGARIHAPWAMAISGLMAQRGLDKPQISWTDDGIAMHLPNTGHAPDTALLVPRPDEVTDLVLEGLADSALFATHFRENAARALLLPRQRPGQRTPLWLQRLRSQQLLSVAKKYPDFPIVIETFRECMQDVFDMPALLTLLNEVQAGTVRLVPIETTRPSPFARSLVYSYIAAFLYEGDAPLAERRAQALTLDRSLLRELLGTEDLRDLLEADAIAAVEQELQCVTPDRHARDAAELHDLLKRLGALSKQELQSRCTEEAGPWIQELLESQRACALVIAQRWHLIASEDAGRYRDAYGLALPKDLPVEFLAAQPEALEQLVLRYASKHGPFTTMQLHLAFGLEPERAAHLLHELHTRGRLEHGPMRPKHEEEHWCHREVLRRIKRRSLEVLRGQIAPVAPASLANYLLVHHNIHRPGRGIQALRSAIEKLAGQPLPWSQLESRILPARVTDYRPEMLDTLCATGELLWIGAGRLGNHDGKVRLLFRHQAGELLVAPGPLDTAAPKLAHEILEELQNKGASFLFGLKLSETLSEPVREGLAYLIWSGRITNDSPGFLRALQTRPRAARAKLRKQSASNAGRWSTVPQGLDREDAGELTRAMHTKTKLFLEAHAVVSRQLSALADGDYFHMAKMLRSMEDQGRVRRGHFIQDLEGSQYALGGTVDRLRSSPESGGQIIAACDPANPWGTHFQWPKGIGNRRAGSLLFSWDGHPVCFLDCGGTKLFTYQRDAKLDLVLAQLMPQLASKGTMRIKEIDGLEAVQSDLLDRFTACEFRCEQKALVLERYR